MKLKLYHFSKTVTAAGTAERLTTQGIHTSAIVIQALSTNTNPVFIGNDTVSSSDYFVRLTAGSSVQLSAVQFGLGEAKIPLGDIWIDSTTNGEGASIGYMERQEGD